ncbi:MAG: AAA family ATPase [Alphaproteobacteria bacterium]|nr:AAA family ATPase [Alphaproteobacteria bacterium]
MTKPDMIVFMGGQGSGKGTFANLLLKEHDFNYVEAGAILRAMPKDSEICKKLLVVNWWATKICFQLLPNILKLIKI